MFKAMAVLFIVGLSEPAILTDQLEPQKTLFACMARGALMIKTAYQMSELAIVKAEAFCLEQEPGDKQKPIEKVNPNEGQKV
jgi:hypothetical protein